MGFELELTIILILHIVGTSIFSRFEGETAVIKKMAKWFLILLLTYAVYQLAEHWALLIPIAGVTAGMIVHFNWTTKHNIDPFKATPRRRYYELRGWQWPE